MRSKTIRCSGAFARRSVVIGAMIALLPAAALSGCATPTAELRADFEYRCRQSSSYTRVENCLNQYRSLGYIPSNR